MHILVVEVRQSKGKHKALEKNDPSPKTQTRKLICEKHILSIQHVEGSYVVPDRHVPICQSDRM